MPTAARAFHILPDMKSATTKTCGRCRQTKSTLSFYPVGEDGEGHPFCTDCLSLIFLQKERQRRQSNLVRLRTCAQCEQAFPVGHFHWIKASKAYHSYCRACHSAYMAIRYLRKKGGSRKLRSAGGRTGT